ncbi:gram-negative porin family protein [Burkholderia cenocepacia]|uniref:Gram-negative porin family protein n=1 Tax=Burkholderia cenocepacia TaxID=95486 RepID=A0AAN0VKF2_9BURK|nr:gram-negative porin family protein [Burkholderia cenocepacia]
MKPGFGVLALIVASQGAWAQGSVTMFGLIDAGISYVSNEGGGKNAKFDDGIFTPNLFGLRGVEDLGGGYRAKFTLVNQFSMANGSIVGTGIFGRNAYVGLESDRLGSITLGNQYEFMVDSLFAKGNAIAMDLSGLYGFRNGPFQLLALPDNPTGAFDWDRTAGSKPVANSVKYSSPTIAGLSGGIMYAFGGVAGSVGANNTVSAGLNYESGPFGIGAAYTNEKYGAAAGTPSTSVRNWGVGMHYTIGAVTAKALLTTVHNSFNDAGVWMAEGGGVWAIRPDLFLGAKYMYMKGNEAVGRNHAHQLSAAFQYLLTKRTMVYVSADYQRANSGANAQINGVLDANGASSSASQAIARIGLHTLF